MKFVVVPFGCQMNRSDSERVRTVLTGMGYTETDLEEEADLLGIVSCSVRQRAIDRVYGRIHLWNGWKSRRPLITFVSGCVLPADREKFLKLFDLVFPIEELPRFPDMIRQYGVPSPASTAPVGEEQNIAVPPSGLGFAGLDRQSIDEFWKVRPTYTSPFEAFVPIQNGCDKFCTFCAVPYTRGREVSRPATEIIGEVRDLVERGYRSITLLGQNVNSYGLDRRGQEPNFPELMRRIGKLGDAARGGGGDFLVYFTSPHPRDMTRELLEVIAAYPVLAKQIHLPLQSGDDKVLMKMNRNHTVDRYRGIVSDIRKLLPEATLFTDIIVGFSGETDEQFSHTREAMEEFRFDMAYIAQYSPRPGAASARWDDDVPGEEKKRRLKVLSDVLMETAGRANRRRIGKRERILVTGEDRKDGFLSGYTEGRIPIRFPSRDANLVGNFVRLDVVSAAVLSVEARLPDVGGDTPDAPAGTPSEGTRPADDGSPCTVAAVGGTDRDE